jgi:hypothetical protein
MPKITPTTAELPILRAALDTPGVDPTFWGTVIGTTKGPQPIFDYGWTHAAGRLPGPGPTVQCVGVPDDAGAVELTGAVADGLVAQDLDATLHDRLNDLPGPGYFSLEFDPEEFGG